MTETVQQTQDVDPEILEWYEALESVLEFNGVQQAQEILSRLNERAGQLGLSATTGVKTPYINTIALEAEAQLPDSGTVLQRLMDYMYWNAAAMVVKANKQFSELGGHIATYASIATLYEVGLNYFFRARSEQHGGDLVFFQGHSSPGIYARGFLEGRFTSDELDHFRQEINQPGLTSYPHPWLMPDFWQFPTVSMGLGPYQAIYQAHFLRYLHNRELQDTSERHVWCFCGDGEMGEPESVGALALAGRESLDNLTFVINCNLQRLDGPVFGNGQIIQELEGVFRGAGWHVIKVIWGSGWDALFAKDKSGLLLKRISELLDGEYQSYSAGGGAHLREHFFGKYPELLTLVADMSDEELSNLRDGGHDLQKVYAAYAVALSHKGQPTVVLAKTVKGYGMGSAGEAQNITHSQKKLSADALLYIRDRFQIPLTDEQVEKIEYYKPAEGGQELQYLRAQRKALGGYLPARHVDYAAPVIPPLNVFAAQLEGSGERKISTTMVYVRILSTLLKDKEIKKHIVPIVADESRTFGMEGLFRQIGINSPFGQLYEPEDKHLMMYYRQDKKGQLLQEGLSEAGAMSSWLAAATSYAVSGLPMIPFYIYYSMFGYQRVGDFVWAAGDMRARGFLLGATAGRTTLAGEGLQHQDGHNLLMFNAVPNCVSYDPTFGYELAVIIQDGLQRMYGDGEDVFYYITLMNENYLHPPMPEGAEEGIIKGMYLLQSGAAAKHRVQLLGSGTILCEVIKAAAILQEYDVAADIWSVTSFNELRRDIEHVERANLLNPEQKQLSYVQQCLAENTSPVIAATDYIKIFPDQISRHVEQPYYVLGTNGFGRSDRRVALRDFFEVDANYVAYTALKALFDQGDIEQSVLIAAQKKLKIDPNKPYPETV